MKNTKTQKADLSRPSDATLTTHQIGKGCTMDLAEFCDRNGIPLVTIVNAINRGTFTEKEGLVIRPSLLKVHTCAFEARFRRPEAA